MVRSSNQTDVPVRIGEAERKLINRGIAGTRPRVAVEWQRRSLRSHTMSRRVVAEPQKAPEVRVPAGTGLPTSAQAC